MDLGDTSEFATYKYLDGLLLFTFTINNLIETAAEIIITAQESVDSFKKVKKVIRFIIESNEETTSTAENSESGNQDGFDGVKVEGKSAKDQE